MKNLQLYFFFIVVSYGVKNVNGHNKLSGPGLNADSEAGMLVGGGKWPSRLVF